MKTDDCPRPSAGTASGAAAVPSRIPRPVAKLWGLLLLILAIAASGRVPAKALFDDAEVRAMLFSRSKAQASAEPLVLLGWKTTCEMNGNGRRTLQEHQVWYIGDPNAPEANAITPFRVLHNTEVELFGLQHCRIYRGDDTLRVENDQWTRQTPRGWPVRGGQPWADAVGTLPPLAAGDVLDVAYVLDNRWNDFFLPSDWAVVPFSTPYAPVIERLVQFEHARTMQSIVEVASHDARLRRHYGRAVPMVEVHTGNIPRGPADPTGLTAPRVYFTSSETWQKARNQCDLFYEMALEDAEILFRAPGDSLANEFPGTVPRMAAVYDYLEARTTRLPRSLTSSSYFPRAPRIAFELGGTDPIERGLMMTALASAARLKADLFLARSDTTGFLPDVPVAHQFDRLALRVLLIEEDRMVWLDPEADSYGAGLDQAADYQLLMATREREPVLLHRTPEGYFARYPLEE